MSTKKTNDRASKKIKVAVLTPAWIGVIGTGIRGYIINLVDELKSNDDLDISVIFREGNDPKNYKISGSRFFFPLKAFMAFRKIRPQIIYTPMSWYFPLAGQLYKKVYGAKIVVTGHSCPEKKLPLVIDKLLEYLLNSCDCITFVSRNLEQVIESSMRINIKIRKEITYPGVRENDVSDIEITNFCDKFQIRNDSTVLLAQSFPIARVKADGAKLLIKAIKLLINKSYDITLILTGAGPFQTELIEFTQKEEMLEHVIFTGWVENPFVPLAICDIYSHISLGEGFPLALLEAMSVGMPIIATPVGGIPEAIEDKENGLLVKPNVEEIAKEIEYLLINKNYSIYLGNNAKTTALEKFTWKKSSEKFIAIFKSLVNNENTE